MRAIRFEAESHQYFVDGREVPSVSRILTDGLGLESAFYTEEGRDRGELVHRITALSHGGVEGIEESLMGYLVAYRQFCDEYRPVWDLIEEPLGHEAFAGTPDRVGTIRGTRSVVDLKTGGPLPWHPLQLSAYEWLAKAWDREHQLGGTGLPYQRMAVYLKADGTYRVKVARRPGDWSTFCALLEVARWKWGTAWS